jgi:glycosyltransferase involved in cell wall biosynthesis
MVIGTLPHVDTSSFPGQRTQGSPPRLLIFVVAYFAESTLTSVLARIPAPVFRDYACSILVVDDASGDRTREIGEEFRRAHPEIDLTVLRNEFNQGYGGNQKVGYTFAMREGFDFVALLHGDGQYAPEELPRLVAPLREGRADAVFGSRMMSRIGALSGGMPFYKFVGNRVLTTLQNRMLGTAFSEFHSGYRVYSVAALRKVPFRLNTNVFHFDTEIIIQLLNAGQRIIELPIPTYYGGEICRVNGMRYAADVLYTTVRSVLHKAGLFYQRRFDPISEHEHSHYDLKLGYASSHQFAVDAIAPGSVVLDIGAGPGGLATTLVRKNCLVTVVDQHDPPHALDPRISVIKQDLDEAPRFDVAGFDYLLLLDIIEHLRGPERFLERLRRGFDYAPKTLILTTPNIAFLPLRLMLLLGQFNYGKAGILDRTHTRLFTFRTIQQLLLDAGFSIKEVRGVPAPFPKVFGHGTFGRIAIALNRLLIRLSRALFSYQIFIVAESTPDVDFVLDDATSRSGRGHVSRDMNTDAATRDRDSASTSRLAQ